MRKGISTGLGIGSSSILMIFILLCLTTFAVLSLTTASADKRLTDKASQAVLEYYAADVKAEERLMEIDDALLAAQIAPEVGYLDWCAENLTTIGSDLTVKHNQTSIDVSYRVPMSANQALEVALNVPKRAVGEPRYRVTGWQAVSTDAWRAESITLPVWPGEENTSSSAG